ncbi:hypothetical protein MKX01_000689 [Papaver californicum]|nr:hypothetical protein MKX01_000689 [Papaver californicum]
MGSVGRPQGLVPYENVRDCSQGFCSFSCPQWCYIIFPPPPPFGFSDDDSSGTNFSPLVIAIIGILASAFLLVSYYTVISKYCRNLGSSNTRTNSDQNNNESNENQEQANNQEPWQIPNAGLDEALIKTITVCKYSKRDGFIDGTDCSVCLSEFQEDESLRLLPKCSHAFHLSCIDAWLKSHANCPLCRANIVCTSPAPLPSVQYSSSSQVCEPGEELQRSNGNRNVSSSTSAVGDPEENNNETIIEIRDEPGVQQIRRSISMGNMSRDRLSIADILCVNKDKHYRHDSHITEEHGGFQESSIESSSSRKQNVDSTTNKLIHTRSKVLHCVMSPVTMKRSTSSGGRFLFSTRHGRSSSRNLDTLPL